MRRAVLAFVIFFLFAAIVLAAGGDPKKTGGDPKKAVVGVWTMGFCNAQSPPYPYGFDCTTQVVNFHKDGSVWSSYMYDQNPKSAFGGPSVGATGRWSYLGKNQFYVTMLRFINDSTSGAVKYLLRTDFTVEADPKSDEALTGKMKFLFFVAEDINPLTPRYVVLANPYRDPWDAEVDGPTGIPMKRVPSLDPDSPVLQ
jgi:hypothetical protein